METFKCKSALNNNNNSKSKLSKTIQKVINLKTSNNGIGVCLLASQNKLEKESHKNRSEAKVKHRAVMEALVAKLFAKITSIKAAYAELQMAQHPYNSDAIQAADQAVVDELKAISELKRSFMKKQLDHISPQVTLLLAEIQEQQSLIKTYEIMVKKLEAEVESKESHVLLLRHSFDELDSGNKSIEKRLNASDPLSMFDNIRFSTLNMSQFVLFLHYTLRSLRGFVKLMIREMQSAHWDLDAAARVIEPDAIFVHRGHLCYVFESFASKTMLEGFNLPHFSSLHQDNKVFSEEYFNSFKKLISSNPKQCVSQNPDSSFAKFTRAKYVQFVHAKMECSLFGNLSQRKIVSSGGCPDSAFFTAFLEMAKRVWLLHCLAFSFGEEVAIFQIGKSCRFSEVHMENVSDDESLFSRENVELRVGFTVVPGFKIGKNVIQSQVYLSPLTTQPT
ncbi:DUF641 domain-containing protein [Cephalotus follicularis]|uniref:DUF641 domain-containing protein n=1 Tax=Cephalotus follicularis TaxID=3775 RepID=A0A1Q3APE9_CEPFO|nr:DUF641 domain-containing protein [Cephalotus follicularis]